MGHFTSRLGRVRPQGRVSGCAMISVAVWVKVVVRLAIVVDYDMYSWKVWSGMGGGDSSFERESMRPS